MTSPVQTFSPEIFHDYDELKSFFSGESEMRYLSSPESIQPKNNEVYMSRWRICFNMSAQMILSAAATITRGFSCGRCSSLSTRLSIWSERYEHELLHPLINFNQYGNRLLSLACNIHAPWDSDVYLSKPFKISETEDPRVKSLARYSARIGLLKLLEKEIKSMHGAIKSSEEMIKRLVGSIRFKKNSKTDQLETYKKERDDSIKVRDDLIKHRDNLIKERDVDRDEFIVSEVNFHQPRGMCRGATKWFGYLFHHCLHLLGTHFSSVDDYLVAITSLFRNGSTKQAAVLQGLPLIENKILDFTEDHTAEFSPTQLTSLNTQTVNELERLPDGYFYVITYGHSIGYIQWKGHRFAFDINAGLIRINKTSQLIDLINRYSKDNKVKRVELTLLTPKNAQDAALTG